MNRKPHTKTQGAVLGAMAMATAITWAEHLELKARGTVDFDITGAALGLEHIARTAKVSEHAARQALRGLEERGDVTASRWEGMGGALTTWQLSDARREAALERWLPVIERAES